MQDSTWSLHAALGRLWTDHVAWTRGYLIAATTGSPMSETLTKLLGERPVAAVATPLGGVVSMFSQEDAAAVRLLKNQEDLGNAIVPFYGGGAGHKLTDLLKQHIMIAVDLVAAARDGNQHKFRVKDEEWTKNAEEIATLLAGANPKWPHADLVDLLNQHLSLTKREVSNRLEKRWDDDVEGIDQIYTEILTLSGVLANGIIKQFPDRFSSANGSQPKTLSLNLALRRLWSDHVIWTRSYLISAVAETPDANAAAARLLKNQEDIGNAIVPFYGPEAGRRLTELLKQHIMIAVDIVDAAKKAEDDRFKDANANWDRNVEEIAAFLSSANPNWPKADLVDLLMQHLNLTRTEVSAHLHKKWHDDVEAFDQILTEILTVADALCFGIVKQFPSKV